MNDPARPELSVAIDRIRMRLETIETKHWEAIVALKSDLDMLEQQVGIPLRVEEPVPIPAPSVEPQPPLLKHLQEAKRDATPPPLPPSMPVVAVSAPSPPPPAGIQTTVFQSTSPAAPASPAAAPSMTPPPLPNGTLEQEIGRVWIVRIGIVLLLTGLVLGANWAYKNWIHHLPPGVRLAGLYLCSLLIGGSGYQLTKREGYKRYGEVLVAGGLAFFYYCTYAAHHVARLRVIESPVAAAVLLLGAAGVIAAVAWFRNSRTTAVMGIVLASYATMIQPLDWLSSASNLFLAVAGIALMLRPGWSGPGIASMIGTYGAFAGWQILGAAGNGRGDPQAAIWFLPASWAIFAIPGMLGRFRASLGDRGRAIFTAANNGLFFLTFTPTWLQCYDEHRYWLVPAVFGAVLLVMGAVGRKREDTAAASNVIQGLALLSLAVVLKFDGYHLALALAGESLALALAFHRFRKTPEFLWSLFCGLGSALMVMVLPRLGEGGMPLWSGGLAAAVVVLAAGVMRFNVGRTEKPRPVDVRTAASTLFYASIAILLWGVCLRLEQGWQLPVAAGLSAAFAVGSLLGDHRRWLPEVAWASGIFGVTAALLCAVPHTCTGVIISLVASLATCLLWHRTQLVPRSGIWLTADPAESPQAFAWLHSVLVPVLFAMTLQSWPVEMESRVAPLASGAVALVGLARALKGTRLEITAPFLNIGALVIVWSAILRGHEGVSKAMSFTPALAAAAIAALASYKRENATLLPQVVIARATLFVAWAAALLYAVPKGFIDLMAVSAAAAFALAWFRKQAAPVDAWGWTVVSLLAYLGLVLFGDGSRFHGYLFEGVGLVLLLAGIALVPPRMKEGSVFQPLVTKMMPWLACLAFTLWSTRIAVDQYGWKSVVVLWTVSGFGLVSLGLVLDRITSRKVGFLLLGMALIKLFAADVWDFTTFMRVVSFIALGLALVLLGLFYHRFAPAVKRLLEEDKPAPAE